jgi:alkylglycerol monooxygenase
MSPLNWLIIIGVPVIIGLVILESTVAKRKKLKLYTLSDSITNLSLGLLERVFDIFFSVLTLIAFNYIHENIAPFQIELSAFTWIIGLLVTDFIAYWFHRLSHEINFLWAAHIVHHQSEELNLTTVFRVSFLAVVYRSFFYVWMALAGFDVFTILTTGVFLGFYQLFTHSRVIGKLGFVEKFMTTPSHHRVHHGRNEKYLDQNYGHIFIFWDKLFGTFIEEDEEPDYGITSGYERANPFNAVFSYWKDLFVNAKKTKSIKNKASVFLKGPAWTPDDLMGLPPEKKAPFKMVFSFEKRAYILFNIAITASCFLALLYFKSKMGKDVGFYELISDKSIVSLAAIIVISIFAHSRVIEDKKFAVLTDGLRLVSVITLVVYGFASSAASTWLLPVVIGYCLIMLLWLVRLSVNSNEKVLSPNA